MNRRDGAGNGNSGGGAGAEPHCFICFLFLVLFLAVFVEVCGAELAKGGRQSYEEQTALQTLTEESVD